MEEQPKKHKISLLAGSVLVFFAVIGDLFGLIPFVKDFSDPIFWVGAGVYFWAAGMGIMNGRRLAVAAISFVAGLIPAIQELPELTLGIVAIIMMTRVEDVTGISLTSIAGGKESLPLNKNGMRKPPVVKPLNQGATRAPLNDIRVNGAMKTSNSEVGPSPGAPTHTYSNNKANFGGSNQSANDAATNEDLPLAA